LRRFAAAPKPPGLSSRSPDVVRTKRAPSSSRSIAAMDASTFMVQRHMTDRLFTLLAREAPEETTRERIEQEVNFDPDLWLVDIEDRNGRAFIETVSDDSDERFTSR
jgi:hypothetical protein